MQILIHLIQHYSTFFHIIYDEYTYPNSATSCYEKAKPQQKYPRPHPHRSSINQRAVVTLIGTLYICNSTGLNYNLVRYGPASVDGPTFPVGGLRSPL
ncbi:hypothetical protein M2444_005849 [Paenibacillus sp. PastF-3]|jgi:hypothetical protein|nr:hypothetical protein [Paenibacillus sp. PastF-3]